jgi:hypothetical protein
MKTYAKILLLVLSISLVSCHKEYIIHPPGISTLEVTGITATTAVCGGELEYFVPEIVSTGIRWWTEQDTVRNLIELNIKDETRFSYEITDLAPNTKYNVRTFVRTSPGGTNLGELKEFTTLPE